MHERPSELEQTEPSQATHVSRLDAFPHIDNLKEYHEALTAVIEFLDSERYQTLESLNDSDLSIIGWLSVQEKELGMNRERIEAKLRRAQEVRNDPNQNRLFQMHGRHWSHFIVEGETREEAELTARRPEPPNFGNPSPLFGR